MIFPTYTTLSLSEPIPHVILILLNRPRQLNVMTNEFFTEIGDCINKFSDPLYTDNHIRVMIIASASDTIFSAGLDLKSVSQHYFTTTTSDNDISDVIIDPARKAITWYNLIRQWQSHLNSIDQCPIPIIMSIHGSCIGGGIDFITTGDIRICSQQSTFSIKEIDLAMTADLGTLQRLPKIISHHSLVREWIYTGRTFSAQDALFTGLVSFVADNRDKTLEYALNLAKVIASKSPLAIHGIKKTINYARDHSIQDGLHQVALWNSSQLQAPDVKLAIASILSKTTPTFSKL